MTWLIDNLAIFNFIIRQFAKKKLEWGIRWNVKWLSNKKFKLTYWRFVEHLRGWISKGPFWSVSRSTNANLERIINLKWVHEELKYHRYLWYYRSLIVSVNHKRIFYLLTFIQVKNKFEKMFEYFIECLF